MPKTEINSLCFFCYNEYMNISAPQNIIELLTELSSNLQKILKDNLVGIYVHGSLAMNCFNYQTSDIDILVITAGVVPMPKRREIADILIMLTPKAPPKGFEISIVSQDNLKSLTYPMPYEFHFSNGYIEKYKDADADLDTIGKTDADLVAHLVTTKARGVTLFGKPIDEVIPDVPRQDYLDSISRDAKEILANISSNPVYNVLNLCRVWAYKKDGLVTSKLEGGEWAIELASATQKAIINQALDEYKNNIKKQWDSNSLNQFGSEISQIFEL